LAHRVESCPGVWVGRDKLVAIGLNVTHGVTQHGFALNVDCDLAPYTHIAACGIKGRGITSMSSILGRSPSMDEVKGMVVKMTSEVLSRTVLKLADQPDVNVGPPGGGDLDVGFPSS
jgi:lipoate-protein ligase B